MNIRERFLSPGWYPQSPGEVAAYIEEWEKIIGQAPEKRARAGMAPHAGWYFSGLTAWRVIRCLAPAKTVVLLGGHLGPRDPVLYWEEDAFQTPSGLLEADIPLRNRLAGFLEARPDGRPDNTLEVQLPLIKSTFPEGRLVCLRVPPASAAVKLGRVLGEMAREEGASFTVLASSDLTHYGPDYGFSPQGGGRVAADWVRDLNDGAFLEAVLAKDHGQIIHRGEKERAACSAGAVAAAAVFAQSLGLEGELLEYTTSLSRQASSSFVGYGAVVFR